MIDELERAFAAGLQAGLAGFFAQLRRQLQGLSAGLVDGRAVARAEADRVAGELIAWLAARPLPQLADRPGDALRVLDALCQTGYTALEAARADLEAERARRFPPPAAVSWREIGELRALAHSDPELCRLGPPVSHVEFASRLAADGNELPEELLALYAACGHVALGCRRVAAASAGGICAGDELRVRDGRVILFDRRGRNPLMQFLEQPGVSIAQALGTWWMVLEDDRAPATRRPLDLQALLRFALRRVEAPTLEALVTELAWRSFFR